MTLWMYSELNSQGFVTSGRTGGHFWLPPDIFGLCDRQRRFLDGNV